MSSIPTRVLAGVTVPDTPLITKAIAYARDNLDDQVYNHVMRSWLFGIYIADHIPELQTRDKELHSVTAILHDLGLATPASKLISADKRFEVDGANATRAFLIKEGGEEWDRHRLQLAWDAVALHTTVSIAREKEVEVKSCSFGITSDFFEPEQALGGVLTREIWEGVVREFPKSGMKKALVDMFCGFCVSKPETTYDNMVGDFGVKYVKGYSLEGRKVIDIIENLKE